MSHRQCVDAIIGTDVDDFLAGLKQPPDESQFVLEEILLLAQHVRSDQFKRVRNDYPHTVEQAEHSSFDHLQTSSEMRSMRRSLRRLLLLVREALEISLRIGGSVMPVVRPEHDVA